VLPAGILLKAQRSPSRTAFHILGTGVSRTLPTSTRGGTARHRLLGIPLWTSRSAPAKP